MDTITATKATEQAGELRGKINALYRRKGEVEGALQKEHVAQEAAMAGHVKLVAELPNVEDAATGAYLHHELDKHDETLRLSVRVGEGLKATLTRLSGEIAGLESELREAESQAARERQAKSLADFRNRLEQAARQAAQDLDNARRSFGSLHLCAAKGIDGQGAEEHRLAALRICEMVFAALESKQINLEARGLKLVVTGFHNTPQTGVFVRPMAEEGA